MGEWLERAAQRYPQCPVIFGLGWGIAGAAWSTILSEYGELALYLLLFLSAWIHRDYATRQTWLLAHKSLRPLLRLGLPMGIYALADMSSFTVWQKAALPQGHRHSELS